VSLLMRFRSTEWLLWVMACRILFPESLAAKPGETLLSRYLHTRTLRLRQLCDFGTALIVTNGLLIPGERRGPAWNTASCAGSCVGTLPTLSVSVVQTISYRANSGVLRYNYCMRECVDEFAGDSWKHSCALLSLSGF